MTFKAGDTVRVKDNYPLHIDNPSAKERKMRGTTHVIVSGPSMFASVKGGYLFYPEELELVGPQELRITKGEGELGRIYERLRKRSYRKPWGNARHEAYVAGVRDALKAVTE